MSATIPRPVPREPGAESARSRTSSDLRFTRVRFRPCATEVSLGVLGKRWTLPILRGIGIYRIDRFNRLLKATAGIGTKMLATRLKELEKAGLIERTEQRRSPILVRWGLTARGYDSIAILLLVAAYTSKYSPEMVFDDQHPKRLSEFLDEEGSQLVRSFL